MHQYQSCCKQFKNPTENHKLVSRKDHSPTYTPIYEYQYKGKTKRYQSCLYKPQKRKEVGATEKLYITENGEVCTKDEKLKNTIELITFFAFAITSIACIVWYLSIFIN